MSAVVYDKREPYLLGKRGIDYVALSSSMMYSWPTLSGYPFSRYVLQSDQLVLKLFWRVTRVIPLAHIEEITVWYSMNGARAQVFMTGTDSTVILCTDHPILLGEAFDKLHIKVEAIEPEIMATPPNEDEGES